MRYVPINVVKDGMILGKTLYGAMGEVLLREGSVIKHAYIKKITSLGYYGIYIQDKLSEDITVKDIISEDLKMQTIKSIKNLMSLNNKDDKAVIKSYEEIEGLVSSMIDEISSNENLIVNMIDLKVANNYTFYHSVNVSVLSIVLGVALNLSKKDLYHLGISSLLHDIGKIFIPPEILDKPTKLTKEEFDTIMTHSDAGYRYIKSKATIPVKSYMGILEHHERFDGTGYPNKRCGKSICLFGRIISIADVYDALTSDRPYRKGVLPAEAMEYIMGGGGSLFDLDIVKVFASKVAPYPIGTSVSLSNNTIGLVVENYSDCCLRPKVKIVKESDKKTSPYIIDLRTSNFNVTITGVSEVLLD